MDETVFNNARIVLADDILEGCVLVRDGVVADISIGSIRHANHIDCEGDFLIPGLVELHTDHLEAHFKPRPKVTWPADAAVLAHDAQIATSGITTVFDALRVGAETDDDISTGKNMQILARAIREAKAAGRLRAEHLLHLRCEIACEDAADEAETFLDDQTLRLISLMDHTPGQRQFVHLDKFKEYYGGKTGMSDAEMDTFIARRQELHARHSAVNRRRIVSMARQRNIPLASHDDATANHVDEAIADGVSIAEFPTTVEAAAASRQGGIRVLMGAPNVVRGGSHSGNISAQSLAERGLLDMLSSDYVPFSLLQAAFHLPDKVETIELPAAIGLVTRNPAQAAGLHDRGEIAIGKRADLVRVRRDSGVPFVRSVWRQGARVV